MVNALFNAIGEGQRLMSATNHDDDFARIHDCANTNCQGHLWNKRDVTVEKAGIGDNCIISLVLAEIVWGRTRVLTRVREVRLLPGSLKAMWPSGPIPPINLWINRRYTAEEQLDSSNFTDFFFVFCTFCFQVLRIAIEDMNIPWINVDMRKQVFMHKRVVRLFVIPQSDHILQFIPRQIDVFVHIECDNIPE